MWVPPSQILPTPGNPKGAEGKLIEPGVGGGPLSGPMVRHVSIVHFGEGPMPFIPRKFPRNFH